jgi:hypothetical protein
MAEEEISLMSELEKRFNEQFMLTEEERAEIWKRRKEARRKKGLCEVCGLAFALCTCRRPQPPEAA